MILWPTPRPALAAAIEILQTAFPSILVSDRMPRVRPDQIVIVDRVGGAMINPRIDEARILVECWGPSTLIVEAMTATAREALRNAQGTMVGNQIFIGGWENENGPTSYDDLEITDMRRWQFSGDLLVSTKAAVP